MGSAGLDPERVALAIWAFVRQPRRRQLFRFPPMLKIIHLTVQVAVMIAAVSIADELSVADLRLNLRKRQVVCGVKAVTVKATPFRLLQYLASNAGKLVTKDAILAAVWGYDFHPGTKIVEVQLHEVRRVLQELSSEVEINTYRGRGMRLNLKSTPGPLAIPKYCNAVPI